MMNNNNKPQLTVSITKYEGPVPEGKHIDDFTILTLTGQLAQTFGMTLVGGVPHILLAMPYPPFLEGARAAEVAPNPEEHLKMSLANAVKAAQMVLVVERDKLTGEQRKVADDLVATQEAPKPKLDLSKFVVPNTTDEAT